MQTRKFSSRKNLYINLLFIGIILFSILIYVIIHIAKPGAESAIIIFVVNFPLFLFFLYLYNSIRFELSTEDLLIKWAFGSKEIPIQSIKAYYEYEEPLFEVHMETRMIGAKITRNDIGSFYYFTPGIRKGLIIEYNPTGFQLERVLIVPKNESSFVNSLRMNILERGGKRIEEFNNKYYVK